MSETTSTSPPRPRIAVTRCDALTDYLESIRQAGGDPVVVDDGEADAASSLDTFAGLVLTGGPDVDPAHYDQARHPDCGRIDAGRDRLELALARVAVERDLPVLAICRGLQVLNVAFGGTLIQDIDSERPDAPGHDHEGPRDAAAHEVTVSDRTRLFDAVRAILDDDGRCRVNSRHHQAIDRLGSGLTVTATSPDGIVEAAERADRAFCVGVQWHPENFLAAGEFTGLFAAFIEACRRAQGSG